MIRYDYIFAGVGLAGLMVLHEMMVADVLKSKKILLLEPTEKEHNDRTWCFWEHGEGEWDAVVTKEWKSGFFINNEKTIECFSSGMKYKMIESSLFYRKVLSELKAYPNLVWKKERVMHYVERPSEVVVTTDVTSYHGEVILNSILDLNPLRNHKKYPLLLQHFQGWFVKTPVPVFDSNSATFMDFSVEQKGNTRFMYVLPISTTEALVEYTLFSAEILENEAYENAIVEYLKQKDIADYEILRKEKGIIPMTAYPFWKKNSKRVLNIGSAGGWTKASTGYTFKNSVKQSKKVVAHLKRNTTDFSSLHKSNRFTFYDSLFVDVLFRENHLGYHLFGSMFSRVKPETVFRFLDEDTAFTEDVKVILSCPKLPFIKALIRKVFGV